MAKCPHCGAEFQYDVKSKSVFCAYCGSKFNPQELKKDVKKSKKNEDVISGKTYSCTQCGATLMTFDETAVTFCSYCSSQNIVENEVVKEKAPDIIIPFSKTQEDCINNYKKKISGFLFAPGYMKSDMVIKKFRGIYMPYAVYKLVHHGDCTNKGKKYNHRSGDYVYYDDYAIHANVDATYDGISFDLLSKFYDEYSQSIPFDARGAEEFNPNYLAGFYADRGDVAVDTYYSDACSLASRDSTRFLKKQIIYSKYGCPNPTVGFGVDEEKYAMFPMYFAAIRSKDNKHIHYAAINGQTGKVAADMPISFAKYIIFSLIISVLIFICLNILPVVLPWVINLFVIIMAIIAWIICGNELSKCNDREGRYNDKGYSAQFMVEDENGKKKKRTKLKKYKLKAKYWVKYLIASLLSLLMIIFHPVHDYYYYGAAIIGLVLVIWSFYDLVKIHNELVSRPIPQLDKRGGDESE
jgi:DNA-directed RNA polymerase subunit RPC12/RpoP